MNICLGDSIAFTSTTFGATAYLWNFGDGNTSTLPNPYHTYLAAGTYTVKFYYFSGVCSNDSTSMTVTVSDGSAASFTSNVTPCNLTVSFTNTSAGAGASAWTFGDGGTSALANPSHTYATSGTYQVTLITGTGSCADTVTHPVTLTAGNVVVNLGPDQNLCTGQTVILDAGNPGDTYLWSNNLTTETIIVTAPGTYSVTVTDGACTGVGSINITYSQGPPQMPTVSINLCPGADTILDAGDVGMIHLWSTGDTTQTIKPSFGGVYFVRISNGGCMIADTFNVNVYPELTIIQSNDTSICPGAQLTLTANGGTRAASYMWNTGGENSDFIIVYQPGTYIVYIKDIYGCITSRSIYVGEFCFSDLYIPNSFTPNGDGINDLFYCVGDSVISFHIYIFDRWGEVVFQSNDVAQGWDGTYNGNLCPQESYVYRVDYQLYDFLEIQKHTRYGAISLIR